MKDEGWEIILNFGLAFLIYISLGYMLSTDMPLTAVVSDSMEPKFYKGDMLLVYGIQQAEVGDVVIYQNPKTHLPVVHRVIEVDGEGRYITKGDKNTANDIDLGITNGPVSNNQLHGKVLFRVPYLGWVKIIFLRTIGYGI